MINVVQITSDTKVLIAAPAKPMSREISDSIGNMVANFPAVLEAHLPYCHILNVMKEPAQVLVLILEELTDFETIAPAVCGRLPDILPTEMSLMILPISKESSVAEKIRATQCQVFERLYN